MLQETPPVVNVWTRDKGQTDIAASFIHKHNSKRAPRCCQKGGSTFREWCDFASDRTASAPPYTSHMRGEREQRKRKRKNTSKASKANQLDACRRPLTDSHLQARKPNARTTPDLLADQSLRPSRTPFTDEIIETSRKVRVHRKNCSQAGLDCLTSQVLVLLNGSRPRKEIRLWTSSAQFCTTKHQAESPCVPENRKDDGFGSRLAPQT